MTSHTESSVFRPHEWYIKRCAIKTKIENSTDLKLKIEITNFCNCEERKILYEAFTSN